MHLEGPPAIIFTTQFLCHPSDRPLGQQSWSRLHQLRLPLDVMFHLLDARTPSIDLSQMNVIYNNQWLGVCTNNE